ncbi:MAG: hypothetical protein QME81_05680 [bacterium]|nr:hypothetical protein [bacterium]
MKVGDIYSVKFPPSNGHEQYTITPQHLCCPRECYDCGLRIADWRFLNPKSEIRNPK